MKMRVYMRPENQKEGRREEEGGKRMKEDEGGCLEAIKNDGRHQLLPRQKRKATTRCGAVPCDAMLCYANSSDRAPLRARARALARFRSAAHAAPPSHRYGLEASAKIRDARDACSR